MLKDYNTMLRIYDHYIDIIYEYFNISEICAIHSTNTHMHTNTCTQNDIQYNKHNKIMRI